MKNENIVNIITWIFILLIILLVIDLMNLENNNQNIKKEEVAGIFYPANRIILEKQLNSFFKQTKVNYSNENIKALIVPHAGYKYSGKTAMYAYKNLYYYLLLDTKENYKIIILAPTHKTYINNIATLSKKYYQTPLGNINIDNNTLKEYQNNEIFKSEHSIEVQLPFIEYIFNKAKKNYNVLPILIGDTNSENIKKIIEKEITENTIIIVSSDLSHFLDYNATLKRDKLSIENIKNNNENIDACGKIGILTLNKIAENNWKKQILNYSTSAEKTNDKSSVVGYTSFKYFTENEHILIKLAKKSIYNKLNNKQDNFFDLKEIINKEYLENKGVFVTIYKNEKLRGCIGNIIPKNTIFESVINNSKSAAFLDHRFEKLTKEEFDNIKIEISILSKPKETTLEDIKKGDGVIITSKFNSAIYLPQVWEQIPNKNEFLESLCLKAGLDKECYKLKNINFKKFQITSIKET